MMKQFIFTVVIATTTATTWARPVNDPYRVCEFDSVLKQVLDGEIKRPNGWYGLLECGCSEKQAKEIWARILLENKLNKRSNENL